MAGLFCTSALFVTDELRSLHRRLIGPKPVEIVPCAAHEKFFFFDPGLREATRNRLGYGEQNTVYVYSGSLTAYQCFPETVALFESVHANAPTSRLLVLTPALAAARRVLAHLPADCWQVFACSLSEVNAFLNAADVGFLMRQRSRTNRVAFPTKFAEYGLTGLGVLTTDALPSVYGIADSIGNLAGVVDGVPSLPLPARSEIASRFRETVGRENFVDSYIRVYDNAVVSDGLIR
jgi:hypothetical protein